MVRREWLPTWLPEKPPGRATGRDRTWLSDPHIPALREVPAYESSQFPWRGETRRLEPLTSQPLGLHISS